MWLNILCSPSAGSFDKLRYVFFLKLIDKYLSGTYLITALKHMIAFNAGKPVYTMFAEVTKDALGDVPSFGGKK